jgi:hypothetical protein
MGSYVTLSINDTRHTSIKCCDAECHNYLKRMLSVIVLNGIMLSVVVPYLTLQACSIKLLMAVINYVA